MRFLLMLLTISLVACASNDTAAVMQQTYVATFKSLTEANRAGIIDNKTFLDVIEPADKVAYASVKAAMNARARGDNVALRAAEVAFDALMKELEPLIAKTKPKRAGVDALALIAIATALMKLVKDATPWFTIIKKLISGEPLTPAEHELLDRQTEEVHNDVQARAQEIRKDVG